MYLRKLFRVGLFEFGSDSFQTLCSIGRVVLCDNESGVLQIFPKISRLLRIRELIVRAIQVTHQLCAGE